MDTIDDVGGGMFKVMFVVQWHTQPWGNDSIIEQDFLLTLFTQWLLSIDISSGVIKMEFRFSLGGQDRHIDMDSNKIEKMQQKMSVKKGRVL